MTDWEQRYLAQDTPWDRGAPSPGLIDFLATHPLEGEVLVPGCGYGYDVRAIASQRNHVVGLDIASLAIQRAEEFPKTAGEEYVRGDLFELPPAWDGRFDWVWEHTCFCAIDPDRRPDYVAAVARVLKPGGRFLGVFYIEPGEEEGPPFGVTASELDGLFNPAFELLESWRPARTYEGREGCELMRHMRRKCLSRSADILSATPH